MKVSEIAEIILPPKFSSKTSSVDELKKSVKFADMLSDIVNNQSDSVNATQENQEVFQPREDIIAALSMTPFTRRCKRCSRIIESGDYCQECAKELASSRYTLSDGVTKENTNPYFKIEQLPMPNVANVQTYENSAEGKLQFLEKHNASDIKENTDEYNKMVCEYCIEFYKDFNKNTQEIAKQEIKSMLQRISDKDKIFKASTLNLGR